jgi:CRISPR-associated protein Cas2
MGNVVFGEKAWLITYDIADPRRLSKVHRLVKSVGIPLQRSVFLAWLSKDDVEELVDALSGIINQYRDDIRIYHLPQRTELFTLGIQQLPGDYGLFSDQFLVSSAHTK